MTASAPVSGAELGELFGLTDRYVRTLATGSFIVKTGHGTYDLAASIQGFVRYRVEQTTSGGKGAKTEGINAEREREMRERADKRQENATRFAHQLVLTVDALRARGVTTHQGLARALTIEGVPTPRGGATWTHTTVARLLARAQG